jgi:hypothetical protein
MIYYILNEAGELIEATALAATPRKGEYVNIGDGPDFFVKKVITFPNKVNIIIGDPPKSK